MTTRRQPRTARATAQRHPLSGLDVVDEALARARMQKKIQLPATRRMADEDNISPTSATSNVVPLTLASHPLHRSHPATTPSLASSLKPAANNDPATPPIVGLLPR